MSVHITFFNYEWAEWGLYHKVTFDGPNRLILINQGETQLTVLNDIYSAWKEWINHDETYQYNSAYLQAFSVVGGEPLPGEESLDSTFFLVNGWRIKPYSGDYRLSIDGNIFTVEGVDPVVPADGTRNNITVTINNSAIVRRIGTLVDGVESIKIDEVWKVHGLDEANPMIVSPTERTAGTTIHQTFTEDDPAPDSVTTRRS